MNVENIGQNTSRKILQGPLLSQCLISKRYDTDDTNMKSGCELQDRLHNEELFLSSLLAEVRDGHISAKADFKGLSNSLQQHYSIDLLPYQLLYNCTLSTKIRKYLAEKLLPTVVLGLEHVIREADRRGLCKSVESEVGGEKMEVRMDVNFNPLNRLAQFLMRNNPKYYNPIINTCRSPYAKAMQQVVDQLKRKLFLQSGSDLAKYTSDSENRKDNMEAEKKLKGQDLADKLRLIEPVFDCFRLVDKNAINSVIIQESVRSFMHIVMKMPLDLSLILHPIIYIENVEEKVGNYTLTEFMTYVMFYVQPLSMEAFRTFVDYMQKCGKEYQNQVNRNIKLDHVAEVSVGCDMEIAGIDKQRLYKEFNQFAQEAAVEIQRNLVHPHDWRIQEYHLRHNQSITKNGALEEVLSKSSTQINDAQLNISQISPVNQDG
ncbi:hypothetical protein ACTXT7_011150 [Hymenolepis weldensis]